MTRVLLTSPSAWDGIIGDNGLKAIHRLHRFLVTICVSVDGLK